MKRCEEGTNNPDEGVYLANLSLETDKEELLKLGPTRTTTYGH